MSNLDGLAFPVSTGSDDAVDPGFTKRERACIDLRIPESGDAELDALIEKARRRDMWKEAVISIASGLAGNHVVGQGDVGVEAVQIAEDVMHQLERTDG